MRLGKNGGTQSKCVEKVSGAADSAVPAACAMTLKRAASTRCSTTAQPAAAQVIGQPSSGRAFTSGRGVDVDERARQGDDVDGVRCHAAILITTLNAEPAETAESKPSLHDTAAASSSSVAL